METPQTERKTAEQFLREAISQHLSRVFRGIGLAKAIDVEFKNMHATEEIIKSYDGFASQEVTLAIKDKDEEIDRLYQVTIAQMNRIKQLEEAKGILAFAMDLLCESYRVSKPVKEQRYNGLKEFKNLVVVGLIK